MTPERLYTLDDVADLFRCSRRTIERLVEHGRLRPLRLGRATRITQRELDAFLSASRVRR